MTRHEHKQHPRTVSRVWQAGPNRLAMRLAWAVLLSLLAATQLLAQGRKIPFNHLTTEDGLSHDSVNCVLQDHSGFMWFGTQDGLSRYDGVRSVVFRNRPSDPSSISTNWVWALLEDSQDNLWVGTDGGGLNLWDPVKRGFRRFANAEADPRSLTHDHVRAIFEDRQGELWVGTEGGLNLFNPETGNFTRYTHNPVDAKSLSDDDVRAIYEDRAGRLWIGTYGGGLNLLDRESGEFTHFRHDPEDPTSLSMDLLRVLFEDAEGNFWIGTYEAGLNRMDREAGTFERFLHDDDDDTSLSENRVRAIYQDTHGVLWIGTDNGLNEWIPQSESFVGYTDNPADPSSLSDDSVQSIYQDRGGVLWVATRAGVNKWNASTGSFKGYHADPLRPSHSLVDNGVWAFAGNGSNTLWVGTYGALTRIDRETGAATHFTTDEEDPTSLADDRVFSLLVDSKGILWVGTFEGGLHRLNADGATFTRFRHDPDDPHSLASDRVASIFEDSEGVLWIGTYGGGLNRFDRRSQSFIRYRHDSSSVTSLSEDRVLALFEDSAGVLWVGTDGGGLNGFDRRTGTFTRFRHDPRNDASLSADGVFSIHEDGQGDLWVGTQGGGLNKWTLQDRLAHRIAFRTFREEDGLLSNDTVYGILEDEEGLLWISTNDGLVRFDPKNEVFRKLDDTHGLQSREFNFGAHYRSPAGEMFFGGNQGFNSFFPTAIRTNTHEPPVVLTSLQKVNRELESETPLVELGAIELTHKDYVVSFEFAALDYTASGENRYAYKLEGFDANWVELGNLNRATYTNLDPGDYTFRVRGANNDGVWSASELAVEVRVVPPWWRTWIAYALYGLVALGFVAKYLHKQARKDELAAEQRRTLEAQVRERTSELAERNEELQRAIHQLELASVTDSLTGLRNRRFLVNTIERDLALVHRMRRDREEQGGADGPPTDSLFLIFDLDGFKEVNDSYGHSAGDRVLVQVRNLLEEACRKSDSIIRWGGDEFLIVARHTDREAAESLAERLRSNVEGHEFDLGNGQTAVLSCSIGFAFYPFLSSNPRLFNWEQVMAVADRALYVAKKSGRNAWVGVYETEKTRNIEPIRLMALINERIEDLVGEGKLELRTSIPDHDHLVWAWA